MAILYSKIFSGVQNDPVVDNVTFFTYDGASWLYRQSPITDHMRIGAKGTNAISMGVCDAASLTTPDYIITSNLTYANSVGSGTHEMVSRAVAFGANDVDCYAIFITPFQVSIQRRVSGAYLQIGGTGVFSPVALTPDKIQLRTETEQSVQR